LITLKHTPQSVGLHWTRDRPVAETSTSQHKHCTRQTAKAPMGFEPSIPAKRSEADLNLRPQGHWNRQQLIFMYFKLSYAFSDCRFMHVEWFWYFSNLAFYVFILCLLPPWGWPHDRLKHVGRYSGCNYFNMLVYVLLGLLLYIHYESFHKMAECYHMRWVKVSEIRSLRTTSKSFQLTSARQWHSYSSPLRFTAMCSPRRSCVLWNPETKKTPENRVSWKQPSHRTNVLHNATRLGFPETKSFRNWIGFCYRTVSALLNSAP
jgi:hypothetical protein